MIPESIKQAANKFYAQIMKTFDDGTGKLADLSVRELHDLMHICVDIMDGNLRGAVRGLDIDTPAREMLPAKIFNFLDNQEN